MEFLNLEGNRHISNISPLVSLKNLEYLHLHTNKISDVSPLAGLSNLKHLRLERNNILNISALDGLREKTEIYWFSNPGFRQGGPKIEGPWLWVYVSGVGFSAGVDLISQASDGAVTELEIATNGAIEGEVVGEYVWTSGKISPVLLISPVLSEAGHEAGHINFGTVVNAMGVDRIYDKSMVYGSITLHRAA